MTCTEFGIALEQPVASDRLPHFFHPRHGSRIGRRWWSGPSTCAAGVIKNWLTEEKVSTKIVQDRDNEDVSIVVKIQVVTRKDILPRVERICIYCSITGKVTTEWKLVEDQLDLYKYEMQYPRSEIWKNCHQMFQKTLSGLYSCWTCHHPSESSRVVNEVN